MAIAGRWDHAFPVSRTEASSRPRIRREGRVVLAAIAVVAASLGLPLSSGAGAQPVPPHLEIRSAVIEELPPSDPADVASRSVALRIGLAGLPPCNATTSPTYGFLIDADKDGNTGSSLAGLGVDARVSAECDPATGEFVSPDRTVSVTTDPASGTATVDIRTTVGLFPSVDFWWVAYAQQGTRLFRLPEDPGHGGWATGEISLF